MLSIHASRYRWVPRLILFCILAPLILFLLATVSAFYLMPSEPVSHADVIIVISGGGPERLDKGLQLYHEGLADRLVLSGAAQDQQGPSNAEAMRQRALTEGIPISDILTDGASATTYQNAQQTRSLLGSDVTSIILVTSSYHQRRAAQTFERVYGKGVRIINAPADVDFFSPLNWWQSARGRRLYFSEYGKLIYVNVTGKYERE